MAYDYDGDAPTNQYPTGSIPNQYGGVALIAVTDDGDTLCETCVLDPDNPVHEASANDSHPDGWGVVGWTTSGETDAETICAHCNKVLVSAPSHEAAES